VKLFFRIGLAILDCTREHILKKCPTSSEILSFLLHIPPEMLTPDILLEAAFKIRLKRSTIRRLKRHAVNELESGTISLGENDIALGNGDGRGREDREDREKEKEKEKDKDKEKKVPKKKGGEGKVKIDGVEFRLLGD
jgi:hypothetical protein